MRPFLGKRAQKVGGKKTTAEACNVSKVVEAAAPFAADRLREDVRLRVSVREALELLALHCHQ